MHLIENLLHVAFLRSSLVLVGHHLRLGLIDNHSPLEHGRGFTAWTILSVAAARRLSQLHRDLSILRHLRHASILLNTQLRLSLLKR